MYMYLFNLRYGLITAAAFVTLGMTPLSYAQPLEAVFAICITDADADPSIHQVELGIFRSHCDDFAAAMGIQTRVRPITRADDEWLTFDQQCGGESGGQASGYLCIKVGP